MDHAGNESSRQARRPTSWGNWATAKRHPPTGEPAERSRGVVSQGSPDGRSPLASIRYWVIGGGVNGLSAAYHLARQLEERGSGGPRDVIVLEKEQVGYGASGIACGVVRNVYFSPYMSELIKLSEISESEAEGFGYHGCGYMAIVPSTQVEDLVAIHRKQREIGYRSELILGKQDCQRYVNQFFPDFDARAVAAIVHEK